MSHQYQSAMQASKDTASHKWPKRDQSGNQTGRQLACHDTWMIAPMVTRAAARRRTQVVAIEPSSERTNCLHLRRGGARNNKLFSSTPHAQSVFLSLSHSTAEICCSFRNVRPHSIAKCPHTITVNVWMGCTSEDLLLLPLIAGQARVRERVDTCEPEKQRHVVFLFASVFCHTSRDVFFLSSKTS